MLTVVAALIEKGGRLLICQRRRHNAFGLKWEFPGGKVRDGERPAEALARELREELGVAASIGPEVYRTQHRYTELAGEIELIFFSAKVDPGAIGNLSFEQMAWVEPSNLLAMDFLPADRELIGKLASGDLHIP